jgi:hypothetical protein
MYCPKCAVRLVEEANFCHNCGLQVVAEPVGDSAVFDVESGGDSAEAAVASDLGDASTPGTATSATAARSTESELPIWEGGFSPKAMAGGWAVTLLATLAGMVAAVALRGHAVIAWLLLVAVFLAWGVQCVRLAKRLLSARYRLTNRRLFLRTGIIRHYKDQLELRRVEDVRVHQTLLGRLCDVGSIEILSSDRRLRRVLLHGIHNADGLAETIRLLAQRVREPVTPAHQPQPQ